MEPWDKWTDSAFTNPRHHQRNIIIGDSFNHSLYWVTQVLGDPLYFDHRRNDIFVTLPSGKVVEFEHHSNQRGLRGAVGINYVFAASEHLSDDAREAFYVARHRMRVHRKHSYDPELFCLLWQCEAYVHHMAHFDPKEETIEYEAFAPRLGRRLER